MLRHLPNALSISRLAIAVSFPLIPAGAPRLIAVAVGIFTDAVDGTIARRLHAQSWIGGVLDAIADKAFAVSILLTLTVEGDLRWLELGLLLSRDLAVGLLALIVAIQRQWHEFKRMPSRLSGKLATALVFVAMLVVLVRPEWKLWAVIPASAASVIAAIDYIVEFIPNQRANWRSRRAER